ncbi:hypothetical protein EJ08DRAFT_672424 [Tothia fuscella]|uniref:Zn(2)-C6 fungal-type domain-containing protein n=1 Tax=Tothia fuscella TaxID=1048955 RepID=A0A9P4NJG3_9PEZI|nr:hypothetical protein EJ08DRAFT_672424 [Tothia fuscella]
MPGVPSGRGCEACRKQKKKCNQAQPSCARCHRLQIPCIGSGQRRFKFQNQTLALMSTKEQPIKFVLGLPRSPSNDMSAVASGFVSALEITDIRYDLGCYGLFMKDIPGRLGSNAVLDASVSALTTSYAAFSKRQENAETYANYTHALKALRLCLDNPAQKDKVNILCAIYMLIICQTWIGKRDDHKLSHGEVVAHLLNSTSPQDWRGDFEIQLLVTLCVPLLVESIINPRIKLDPWIWAMTETYGPQKEDPHGIGSLKLRNLAKFPRYVRHPELCMDEITMAYTQLVEEVPKLATLLVEITNSVRASWSPTSSPPIQAMRLLGIYQVSYGIGLTLAMILNRILRAFDPFNALLLQEFEPFLEQTMKVAEQALRNRPLGSGYVPICLVAAWSATSDPFKRLGVEQMMIEYQKDFPQALWMEMAEWLTRKFHAMDFKHSLDFLLVDSSISTGSDSSSEEPDDITFGAESCTIM